jgi:hypothetical protein
MALAHSLNLAPLFVKGPLASLGEMQSPLSRVSTCFRSVERIRNETSIDAAVMAQAQRPEARGHWRVTLADKMGKCTPPQFRGNGLRARRQEPMDSRPAVYIPNTTCCPFKPEGQ